MRPGISGAETCYGGRMEMEMQQMNRAAGCTLCAEISGTRGPNLYRQLKAVGTPESRIVLETSAFVAMPSLGQIVDGYVILCSSDHVPRSEERRVGKECRS